MRKKYVKRGFWQVKEHVIADAQKYRYQSEWTKASPGAVTAAQKNGWFAEACLHMISPKAPMGFWTLENLILDAKKYQSPGAWKKGNASAYASARANRAKGWLKACCAHMTRVRMPSGFWTKERVIENARSFRTVAEWSLSAGDAYDAAKRNGWIEEATKHMVRIFSHGEYTIYSFLLEHDIRFVYQKRFDDLRDKRQLPIDFYLPDFNLAIEFQGRQHFDVAKSSMFRKDLANMQRRDLVKRRYAEAYGMNYLEIDSPNIEMIEVAITSKLQEIAAERHVALGLKRRKLTAEETGVLASLGIWTKEAVLADALKYHKRGEWKNCGNAAYQIACKNGWAEEACRHMIRTQKPKGYWTKERVLEDAMRYLTPSAWFKASQSAWQTAQAKGWLAEATAHMTRRGDTANTPPDGGGEQDAVPRR